MTASGYFDNTNVNITKKDWISGQGNNAIDFSSVITGFLCIMVPDNDLVDFGSRKSFTLSALMEIESFCYTNDIQMFIRTG